MINISFRTVADDIYPRIILHCKSIEIYLISMHRGKFRIQLFDKPTSFPFVL